MHTLPKNAFIALVLAITLIVAFPTSPHAENTDKNTGKKTPTVFDKNIVHREKSQYQNIDVIDTLFFHDAKDDTFKCLSFETAIPEKRILQGCQFDNNADRHVLKFSKMLMAPLLFVEPDKIKRLLFIGMGIGTTPKTYAALFPDAHIDVVELDPKVVQVAETFFNWPTTSKAGKHPHITTHVQDGRLFAKRQLANAAAPYDIIVLDAFNSEYIPEHLMTREFLTELKQLLAPHGVLATNTFAESGLFQYESATYAAVFGSFYNFINYVEDAKRYGNRIIIAQQNGVLQPVDALQRRAATYRDTLKNRFGIDVAWLLEIGKPQDTIPADAVVLTDQYSPANLLKDQTKQKLGWQQGRAILLVLILFIAFMVVNRHRKQRSL